MSSKCSLLRFALGCRLALGKAPASSCICHRYAHGKLEGWEERRDTLLLVCGGFHVASCLVTVPVSAIQETLLPLAGSRSSSSICTQLASFSILVEPASPKFSLPSGWPLGPRPTGILLSPARAHPPLGSVSALWRPRNAPRSLNSNNLAFSLQLQNPWYLSVLT